MNNTRNYHSDFFTVAASRAGLRIRNDEVVGSIPTSSTIFSITYGAAKDQFCPTLSQKVKLARCLPQLNLSAQLDAYS
jgi:hypothetical protein